MTDSTQEDTGLSLTKPAPSAEPEYVDYRDDGKSHKDLLGAFWLYVPRLRTVLSRAGLAIVKASDVDEASGRIEELEQMLVAYKEDVLKLRQELSRVRADVPTPEDRKVLEAMAAIKQRWLEDMVRTCTGPAEWVETCVRLFKAELARRAAKEGKTDG